MYLWKCEKIFLIILLRTLSYLGIYCSDPKYWGWNKGQKWKSNQGLSHLPASLQLFDTLLGCQITCFNFMTNAVIAKDALIFRIFAVPFGMSLKCLVALQYKQLDHFHLLPPFSMKARVKGKSFRIQKNFFSLCNAPGMLLFKKNSQVCKREVTKLLGKNCYVPNLLKSTSVLKKRKKKEKFGHSLAL